MRAWRGRTGWVSLLVVVVGGAGVAAALPGSPVYTGDLPSSLAAAGIGDGATLGEQTTTTAASPVRAATASTPTSAPPVTARVTPTTRAGTVPATPGTTPPTSTPSQPGFTTTTQAPGRPPLTVPPPVNPPEWTFEGDGLHARVRITPIAPRVGDTVEFTIETWTDLPGVTCCNVILQYAGRDVLRRWPEPGPCPAPPPRSERVSYRITEPTVSPIPGPFAVGFLLHVGSTFDPCAGLQQASRSLVVTVPVVVRLPGT